MDTRSSNPLPTAYCLLPTAFCLPPRAVQPELLDLAIDDHADLVANLADLRVVNRWLGGTQSVVRAVAAVVHADADRARPLRILDVATGSGDVPLALRAWGQQRKLVVYASDLLAEVLAEARTYTAGRLPLLRHDALHIPIPDGALDIVTCAQALHHFDPPEAIALLRELARVARVVIVADLRRSWLAYAGAHALTLTQRSAMSRHDGPLSVLRAYTPPEVRQLCAAAGLVGAMVRRDGIFRMVLVWSRNELESC